MKTAALQPVTLQPAADPTLLAMTAEQRLCEFETAAADVAHRIARLARVVYAMKVAGDDMTPVQRHLGGALRLLLLIGSDRVLVEVFTLFGYRPDLWRKVASLDVVEQRKIVESGGRVPLLVLTQDGRRSEQMELLHELKDDELARVFGEAGLRTPEQQDAYLRRERLRVQEENSSLTERIGCAVVDPELGIVRVRTGTLSKAQIKAILRKLEQS